MSMKIRIGVVGSRERNSDVDRQIVWDAIGSLMERLEPVRAHHNAQFELVSGGCRVYNRKTKEYDGCGADYFAEKFAAKFGFTILIHYPQHHTKDPNLHPMGEARRVNYERNTFIANDSFYLIACVRPDRKGGTEDTIKKFVKRVGLDSDAFDEKRLILC